MAEPLSFWDHIAQIRAHEEQWCERFGYRYSVEIAPLLYDWEEIEQQCRQMLEAPRTGSYMGDEGLPDTFVSFRAHKFLSLYQVQQEGRPPTMPHALVQLLGVQLGVYRFGKKHGRAAPWLERARKFIADNPGADDVSIAAEVGKHRTTILRARRDGKLAAG